MVLQQLVREKSFGPGEIGTMDELPLHLTPSLRLTLAQGIQMIDTIHILVFFLVPIIAFMKTVVCELQNVATFEASFQSKKEGGKLEKK